MWFIYVLLCLIAVVVLVVCIPVEFDFGLNTREAPRLHASYKWWFGVIKGDIRKKYPTKKKVEEKKKVRKPRRLSLFSLFEEAISRKEVLKPLFVFVKRNFESIKIKELAGEFEIGLDDPINNAWLFAFAVPLNYLLLRKGHRLNIKPVFSADYYFSCDLTVRLRVFPIQIIRNVLQLVFSAPGRRFTWALVTRKWKKVK